MKYKFLPAALLLWALCTNLVAQPQNYPAEPVKIIVGFPPGQATDILARLIAEHLQRELKQPFIVENRPGAGGVLPLTEN